MKRRDRPTHTNGGDFKEARLLAGLTRSAAAALLHVSVRTVRNWENSRSKVPFPAFELMRILSGYELPGEAWRGWTLKGDMLWSPEGRGFQADRLAYWGLTCAMARQWQQEQEQRDTLPPTDIERIHGTVRHGPAAQAGARGPRHSRTGVSGGIESAAYAQVVAAPAGRGGERAPVHVEPFKQPQVSGVELAFTALHAQGNEPAEERGAAIAECAKAERAHA